MTAGIPHGALTYEVSDYPDETEVMAKRAMVVFEPGETFHYSNFSIAVLDNVIEKVSKRSFADFVDASVFTPLAMDTSSVGESKTLDAPAKRYAADGESFPPLTALPRSSRQMYASLSDLLKYAAFQLHAPLPGSHAILADATINQMHNELSGVPGSHVALGWGSLDIDDGRRWVISSGNDMGVQSSLTLLPYDGVGVVVLTNTSGYQADEIGIRIADAASQGFLERAIAAIENFEGQTSPYAPSPEWMGTWSGAVRATGGDIPVTLAFDEKGAMLITLGAAPAAAVEEPSVRHDLLTGSFEGMLPLEESAGRPHRIEMGLQRNGEELEGFLLANFRSERGKFEIPAYCRLTRN
jgi:CubicO group peptidase (beta-lactamase class C family)